MEAALAAIYQTALFISQTFGTSLISTYAVVKFVAVTAASMAASKLLAPKTPGFSDSSLAVLEHSLHWHCCSIS